MSGAVSFHTSILSLAKYGTFAIGIFFVGKSQKANIKCNLESLIYQVIPILKVSREHRDKCCARASSTKHVCKTLAFTLLVHAAWLICSHTQSSACAPRSAETRDLGHYGVFFVVFFFISAWSNGGDIHVCRSDVLLTPPLHLPAVPCRNEVLPHRQSASH